MGVTLPAATQLTSACRRRRPTEGGVKVPVSAAMEGGGVRISLVAANSEALMCEYSLAVAQNWLEELILIW